MSVPTSYKFFFPFANIVDIEIIEHIGLNDQHFISTLL